MSNDVITTRELLESSSNEDLEPLVGYIMKAPITEGLSISSAYKRHHPNHTFYASEIYHEIRRFGGNTFANLFRNTGPSYYEVLRDVAKKVGVKDTNRYSKVEIERLMIVEILRKALKNAKGKEREDLEERLRQVGLDQRNYKAFIDGAGLSSSLPSNVYSLFMFRASSIIADGLAQQILGQNLRAGRAFAFGRAGSVLIGPVAWVAAGLWNAGPAYGVTFPCTLHIAMLRQKWISKQEVGPLEEVFND